MDLKNRKKTLRGFTLIELLVVVAIIGLLTSIISVAINTSRTKSRDARRVTDMKQIKTGLDLYFSNAAGYPDTAAWVPGVQLSCNGGSVMRVPQDPTHPVNIYDYTGGGNSTSGCGTTVRSTFELEFYIENKGLYYIMDQTGKLRESLTGTTVGY